MYTLVVVDMQPQFGVSDSLDVTKNCQREISKAIEDGAHIIFLEFEYYGPSLKELTSLPTMAGYLSNYSVIKTQDDGSVEVANFVHEHDLYKTHFKVVGINTDYCVYATVRGLTFQFPEATIEVIGDACDSLWGGGSFYQKEHHLAGLEKLKKLDGVNVTDK